MVVGVEKQILCANSTMPKKKQADENQSVTEKQIQIRRANETLIPAISGGRNYTHCTSALRLLTHISKQASVIFDGCLFAYVGQQTQCAGTVRIIAPS